MLSLAKRAVVLDRRPLAAQIPTDGLLAWWDAERSVYTDTGLTTPAVDGGAVAGWSDQGISGYHVTQSVAGDRPLWRASVAAFGGKPGVEFVSSDLLTRTGLSGAVVGNATVHTVYVVFSSVTAAAMTFYSEGSSASSVPFVTANMGANVTFSYRDGASLIASGSGGSGANSGAPHLFLTRRIAADSWSLRYDGVQIATSSVNLGSMAVNQLALGAFFRTTTTQFYTGHIAQVLLFNTDNYATIEPILRSYYGIA